MAKSRKSFLSQLGVIVVLAAMPAIAVAQVTSLTMQSDSGDYIGQGQTYSYTPADGTFSVTAGSGIQVSFSAPNLTHWWYLQFAAADGAPLTQGTYTNAMRWPFQSAGFPGLSVYGDGRGCNTLTGDFQILQLTYDASGNVASFDATFTQHCEGMVPALRGEIRYNANVALYLTAPAHQRAITNQPLTINVSSTDAAALPVTLSATGVPSGASFTDLHNGSGVFSWTPSSTQTGVYSVVFQGTDTAGANGTLTTEITVIPPPPANDESTSATPVPAIPFAISEDATNATVALTDPWCYGSSQSVWFKYTPSADVRLEANTFGSSYDTTLSVYTGNPPSGLIQKACNDDSGSTPQSRVIFDATAGTTYYFMVGSLYYPVPSAQLVFNVKKGPPPFSIAPTVNQFGSVSNQTGAVTVSGTVTCNAPSYITLFGQVKQMRQGMPVAGFFSTWVPCDGPTPWSANVISLGVQLGHGRSALLFGAGRANVGVQANGFDPDTGEFKYVNVTSIVQLRGK
jgi:hypothetical protein